MTGLLYEFNRRNDKASITLYSGRRTTARAIRMVAERIGPNEQANLVASHPGHYTFTIEAKP